MGSGTLEEWVKHESEGYPVGSHVPDYRIIGVAYRGTFSGPFGSGIRNAQLPSFLIEKFAGKEWVDYQMRESMAAIDEIADSSSDGDGTITIDASNLMLLLQGKVYEDLACNGVVGLISRSSLIEIQHKVRSRILELTLELEKSVPMSADITYGKPADKAKLNTDTVTQIS